jgi:hypothetical protein
MDVKEKRDGRGEGRERKRKFFKGGRERERGEKELERKKDFLLRSVSQARLRAVPTVWYLPRIFACRVPAPMYTTSSALCFLPSCVAVSEI